MDSSKVENLVCPRCGGGIPNSQTPGAYPGALSRTDNRTEICSDCGSREAGESWGGVDLKKMSSEARAWWSSQRSKTWTAAALKQ